MQNCFRRTILICLILISFPVVAKERIIIRAIEDASSVPLHLKNGGLRDIQAKQFRLVNIDLNALKEQLLKGKPISEKADIWIELPLPDQKMHLYRVKENDTMAPELAKNFPEIRAYDGYHRDNQEWVKFEVTPRGFHAMIIRPGKSTVYIDPYVSGEPNPYMVYQQSDYISNKTMNCTVKHSPSGQKTHLHNMGYLNPCVHRTYRLALAATYPYTQFAGGTVLDALSSQVTTVNRVNGIYESEAAITLQLIGRNDLLICTYPGCFSPSAPPYYPSVVPYHSISTGGTTTQLAEANQINTDIIIGSANYDIGHVLDYNGGYKGGDGLAWTPSVCNSTDKAKGATSGTQPLSDVFAVDFLAHEIGHQFSATHTQNNNCNRETVFPTTVEPGSGSTIMGYAGICAPNVQSTSGPYFHGVSLQQITNYVQGAGNCSVNSSAGVAQAPVILASSGNSTVPVNTPFALNLIANSTSGATLTYNWEQMDPEISVQPPESNASGGPNFRSFSPSIDSTRFFPNLLSAASSAAGGVWPLWEVIPSVPRIMNFRATVRNNISGPSCNAYRDYTVTEVNEAGGEAFMVTQPTKPGIFWRIGSIEAVTWEVANTNTGSVAAETVDILLSTDGGISYPFILATNVPNSGAFPILVPNFPSSTSRVMVTANNRTFFNVSAHEFAIANPQITAIHRNPIQRNSLFLDYAGIPVQWLETASFYLNTGKGDVKTVSITPDIKRGQLILNGLSNAQSFIAKIRIEAADGVSVFTGSFIVPSALTG